MTRLEIVRPIGYGRAETMEPHMIKRRQKPDPVVYMDQEDAKRFMLMIMSHLPDWPIKTAESFRNALLGNGAIAINPMLGIEDPAALDFLKLCLKTVVAEGRMIDFGFIPNELMKQESLRSRRMFEAGEFQHPYDTWLAIAGWEGGMCGYLFMPHPEYPERIVCIELYGVSVPHAHGADAILIYDIVGIEVEGTGKTRLYPAPMLTHLTDTPELLALEARGANSLDPLVTMLRLLADASIPIIDRPAPIKLNKARAKQGKFPIPPHAAVLTKDYVSAFQTARASGHAEKGTHASPIAHWRRAHKRMLADGRIIPVRSSKVNWRDTEEIHRLFYRVPKEKPSDR